MDTYSHIIEGMQEYAMALLDEVLPAGVSQKNNTNYQYYGKLQLNMNFGRGVRVADGDGLENRCRCKPTVGSNPTPSAIL